MRSGGSIQVWRHDAAILERGLVSGSAPADVPRHTHEEFQFSLELTGPVEYELGARHVLVEATQLVVIPPGMAHSMRDPGPRSPVGEYQIAFVPARMIEQHGALPASFQSGALVISDHRAVARFRAYHCGIARGDSRLALDEYLMEFLQEAWRGIGVQSSTVVPPRTLSSRGLNDRLDRVRQWLLADLSANISLAELAARSGLAPTEVCRAFARRFGVPPHRFLLNARIDRAKRLLHAGQSITSAALATGFSDQAHFTRHFKRLVQVTPGRYSKNIQD